MHTLPQERVFTRLQLTVTALETFYIAAVERKYLWDVSERVKVVCEGHGEPAPGGTYWADLNDLRNDITHRAGIPKSAKSKTAMKTALKTEQILGATLCWAFKNKHVIDSAFQNDRWPQF